MDEDEFEAKETEGTTYYVLSVSEKKTLINGFMYIKELLLQYHNFKMHEAYKTLSDNNIKVYSVKTDCLTIHEDDVDKVYGYSFCRVWREGLLKFGTDIGTWRLEEKKTITLPTQLYTYKFNEVPEVPKISNVKVEVEDEWDTKTICEKIMLRNPVIIRGKFPGTGKSYIGEFFQKMGKNVLFVVPTKRLLQEKEVEATTYNKFFSIAVHEAVGEKLPLENEVFQVLGSKAPYRCLIIPLSMWWCLTRFICLTYMFWIRSDGSLKKILILSLLGRAM